MKKVTNTGIFVIIIALLLSICNGCSSSNSGRKYSDLSEQEKRNAKWAYEAKQAVEKAKKSGRYN